MKINKCKVGSKTFLSSTPGCAMPWSYLWVSWPCVGTTGCQPSPRERLGSSLWLEDCCSIGNGCKGECQDRDFFSCTCFALNVMESKILQRFSLKILVVALKTAENFAASLCLVFSVFLMLRPGGGISLSCWNRKCVCVLPRNFA